MSVNCFHSYLQRADETVLNENYQRQSEKASGKQIENEPNKAITNLRLFETWKPLEAEPLANPMILRI